MKLSDDRTKRLEAECVFSSSRSSGPGGQNVNKVNTKVELRFSLISSSLFSEEEKKILFTKLSNRINTEGEIVLTTSSERSQFRNKELVIEKFILLVEKALTPAKKRIKTKPTKASRIKRIEGKKLLAKKKQMRKKPDL